MVPTHRADGMTVLPRHDRYYRRSVGLRAITRLPHRPRSATVDNAPRAGDRWHSFRSEQSDYRQCEIKSTRVVSPEWTATLTGDVPDWSEDTRNCPGASENLYVMLPWPD